MMKPLDEFPPDYSLSNDFWGLSEVLTGNFSSTPSLCYSNQREIFGTNPFP